MNNHHKEKRGKRSEKQPHGGQEMQGGRAVGPGFVNIRHLSGSPWPQQQVCMGLEVYMDAVHIHNTHSTPKGKTMS